MKAGAWKVSEAQKKDHETSVPTFYDRVGLYILRKRASGVELRFLSARHKPLLNMILGTSGKPAAGEKFFGYILWEE